MKHQLEFRCLSSIDLAAYMAGTIHDQKKRRIERHLSDCDFCFADFIDFFNQHLECAYAQSRLADRQH